MGVILWALAGIAVFWFSIDVILPIDRLLFSIGILTSIALGIKAVVDLFSTLQAMSDGIRERRGDFDD